MTKVYDENRHEFQLPLAHFKLEIDDAGTIGQVWRAVDGVQHGELLFLGTKDAALDYFLTGVMSKPQ